MAIDPAAVRERVERITARLGESGRAIELLAVTKGFGAVAVAAAAAAGCTMMGENYAQELIAKLPAGERPLAVHFIGRLQSNKVGLLAPYVDVWESVDRPELLDRIARRAPGATVLIQVNATGEPGKGGCRPEAAVALVEHGRRLGLDVDGMMTVGPTSGAGVEGAFAAVRALVDECGLPTCSMGMSDDLDAAIAAGTTRVRLGTAIFGERPSAGSSGP